MKFSTFYETRRPLPSSHVSFMNQIYPVHALTSSFFKIHFNIILPSTPRFSKCSLSFGFPHQNTVGISFPLYMPHSRHLILPKNLLWGTQITKLTTVEFYQTFCYFISRRSKYFPNQRIVEYPDEDCFLLGYDAASTNTVTPDISGKSSLLIVQGEYHRKGGIRLPTDPDSYLIMTEFSATVRRQTQTTTLAVLYIKCSLAMCQTVVVYRWL
jgi:hypothetical protein